MIVMMAGEVASGIISGATQLIGNLLTNASVAKQNRKSRRFAEGMYERQKQDNIDFWRMQNSYNDPSAQMQRLRDAGLNPALIYGSNASGASGAAGSIDAPKVVDPDFNPADFSGAGAAAATTINSIYDLRIKKNQSNNLAAQNDLIAEQAKLAAAQRFKTLTEDARGRLGYKLDKELYEVNVEAAREALRQTTTATDVMESQNQRDLQMHGVRYRRELEQLAIDKVRRSIAPYQLDEARERVRSLIRDNKIKDFEIMLNDLGLTKGSGVYFRLLSVWARDIADKVRYHMNRADQKLKK